jgi:hypothetical protein
MNAFLRNAQGKLVPQQLLSKYYIIQYSESNNRFGCDEIFSKIMKACSVDK